MNQHDVAPRYELLLRGGTVLDPAQGLRAGADVGFANGCVAAVEPGLRPADAAEAVDCSGLLVAPGMIDLHVHVFYGVSHYGIEPDPNCVAKGVTTAVDAGSAGADTFPGFRKYVIDVAETRLFARLNISSMGMLSVAVGELDDLRYASVPKAIATIAQHRDVILGVKVRLTRNQIVSRDAGMKPLFLAREAADAVRLPIMVHPQEAWCESLDDILAVMRGGDMLTHCFHGLSHGILDEHGRVRRSVQEAMERGVIFDVGHGRGSFSWQVAETALRQGVQPQTISSDLHAYNVNGPAFDLATTVSKFLHLGLSLEDSLHKVTATPAQTLGMADRIGTLRVGAWGDAVAFELQAGEFRFEDSHGEVRTGRRKLVPKVVVRAGRVYRERPGAPVAHHHHHHAE
ncbi:MAG TPA: amidohydrolase/deacetylase family metallohydrolase [bacterium]|nr:amidohydrolase/deacetylase family metallohydrolase [bacterium]